MSESATKTKTSSWQPTTAAISESHLTPRPFPLPVNNVPQVQASQDLEGYRKPQNGDMIDNVRRYQQVGTTSQETKPTAATGRQLIAPALQSSSSRIQPKMTIGEPGDRYEQEADQVASEVVQRINAPASVQRRELRVPPISSLASQPDRFAQGKLKPLIQRQKDLGGGEATTELESSINSARGGGQPLEVGLQHSMGQVMGADFSGVRVHTDSQADQLNQSVQAKAFTTGQDVFFRQGAYEPGSRGGQELIAHELTHVVQQNGGQIGPMLQCKEENNAALAKIQGLPMYELLTRLQALSTEVRTDEESGGFVGGPRLVTAMRAVRTKFDRDLVGFLTNNKRELESLPSDQFGDILNYLGSPNNSAKNNHTDNSSTPVSQLSTTDKFSAAVSRAMQKLPNEVANRLQELLSPESIAVMVSFTAVYIASQVTPAGWVADGIGLGLILASAIMIGPEVVTIVEHIIGFAKKASNAKTDEDLDAAGDDLAIAVTKLGADVVMAILLHKVGKAGTKAVKTYVKPSPALVDVVTADGRIIRVPEEQISQNISESRGSGGKGKGGKVSLVDGIRSLGDDFLDQSEGRGGHTIEKHIARTNQELIRRANKEIVNQENVDATTFDNKSSAIAAVRYNLRTNAPDIAAWLEDTGASNRKTCDAQHPMRIGRGVKAGRRTVDYDIGVSRIVLVKDPTMPLGFRILTAFPVLQP